MANNLEGSTVDDRRFDSFSRLIAQGASRRTVIRGLFAGGVTALAGSALSASAKADKVDLCHLTGDGSAAIRSVPAKQVDKWIERGYFAANDCGDGPTCESCCTEWHEPCINDSDCCSGNCLESGICGDLCYCINRYDPDEQTALGPMCGGSAGALCTGEPGCLSSADCAVYGGDSYYDCVMPDPDCVTSGGMCAYPLFSCEQ